MKKFLEDLDESQIKFFRKKEIPKALLIGETILGVSFQELGLEFIYELDSYIDGLDSYLRKDIHSLYTFISSRLMLIIKGHTHRSFDKMSKMKRDNYLRRWMESRISIFRTGFVTIKSLSSWAYYSLEQGEKEIEYPGVTINREHITPTLLFGSQPLDPKDYLEE